MNNKLLQQIWTSKLVHISPECYNKYKHSIKNYEDLYLIEAEYQDSLSNR